MLEVSTVTKIVLIASGAFGILIGLGLVFLIIRHLGIIVFYLTSILVPLFTGIMEFILFGKTLTPVQITFGGILIFGCSLVIMDIWKKERVITLGKTYNCLLRYHGIQRGKQCKSNIVKSEFVDCLAGFAPIFTQRGKANVADAKATIVWAQVDHLSLVR